MKFVKELLRHYCLIDYLGYTPKEVELFYSNCTSKDKLCINNQKIINRYVVRKLLNDSKKDKQISLSLKSRSRFEKYAFVTQERK